MDQKTLILLAGAGMLGFYFYNKNKEEGGNSASSAMAQQNQILMAALQAQQSQNNGSGTQPVPKPQLSDYLKYGEMAMTLFNQGLAIWNQYKPSTPSTTGLWAGGGTNSGNAYLGGVELGNLGAKLL
jgi:hypothetical protein